MGLGVAVGSGVGIGVGLGVAEIIGVTIGVEDVVGFGVTFREGDSDGVGDCFGVDKLITGGIGLILAGFCKVSVVSILIGTCATLFGTCATFSVTMLSPCAKYLSPVSPSVDINELTPLLTITKAPERASPTTIPVINDERIIIPVH